MSYADSCPRIQIPKEHFISVKWPQLIITGTPVTPEQAFEIIRRTDTFLTNPEGGFGNRKTVMTMLRRQLGFGARLDLQDEWSAKYPNEFYWSSGHSLNSIIAGCLGAIVLQYQSNHWGATSYAGGPHGWITVDGQIGYRQNIGKHPGLDEVIVEWEDLTDAFPFLDMQFSLYNHESGFEPEDGSARKTANFSIKDKHFIFHDHALDLHGYSNSTEVGEVKEDPIDSHMKRFMTDPFAEHGLSAEFINRVGQLNKPIVDKIVSIYRGLCSEYGQDAEPVHDWLYRCQTDLETIDMNKAPQHAIIHERFITEAGIKFPFLEN